MTDDDISAQVAAILHDWTPHAFGYAKQDGDHWIIGGLYEGAPYWKHTGLRPDGPDTPDDPIAAARWLDAHAKARHQPKEPPHAETIQHEQAGAGDVRDPSGADVATAEAGVRAADGGGGDSGGVDGAAELEDAVSAQAAEYVAAEVVEQAPADSALDAEVTEAPGQTYAGSMIDARRNDIAGAIGAIARDRAFASEDFINNVDEGALNNRLMMGLASDEDRALSGELGRRKALVKRIYVHADALQRSLRDWPADKLDDFDPNDPLNPWPT